MRLPITREGFNLIKYINKKAYYINSFNRYRILRNKAVYKGEKISVDMCKEALMFLEKFLPKLKKEFNRLK